MKLNAIQRKKFRVTGKLKKVSSSDRLRLSISRSAKNISAQIIDDVDISLSAGNTGALMAMSLGQVDPESMINWTVSGELVFVTILSGPGNVIAPFIGSLVFEVLRTYAFELAPQAWQLIMGATFLTIIFFLPGGIWSLIEKLGGKKNEK